jgi:hypothetical protein
MMRALIVIVIAACRLTAQTDSAMDLWVRVREHVRASAAGLPNYSCQETMERSIQDRAGQVEFRERLRLEVLFTDTTELFAWPGSLEFTAEPLESWIGVGAIGNGDFASELLNIFVISAATVKYWGLETRDGHALHRFDFHMPLLSSRYSLSMHGKSAITAYSGSFWVDQQSLDLVRLETRAEEIPSDLDCKEAHQSVTYGRVRLGTGGGVRVLPSAAELGMASRDGHESRNTIAFSKCRQYATSSSLLFTTPPETAAVEKINSGRAMPADAEFVLRMERPILIGESAAGDPIEARLDKAVTAGAILLPKGTRVLGRIRRLEQHLRPTASIQVGLEFFAAETPDGLVSFRARLTGPRGTPDVTRFVNNRWEAIPGAAGLDIEEDGAKTGVGSFRVAGKELRIERGFRTVWKTQ